MRPTPSSASVASWNAWVGTSGQTGSSCLLNSSTWSFSCSIPTRSSTLTLSPAEPMTFSSATAGCSWSSSGSSRLTTLWGCWRSLGAPSPRIPQRPKWSSWARRRRSTRSRSAGTRARRGAWKTAASTKLKSTGGTCSGLWGKSLTRARNLPALMLEVETKTVTITWRTKRVMWPTPLRGSPVLENLNTTPPGMRMAWTRGVLNRCRTRRLPSRQRASRGASPRSTATRTPASGRRSLETAKTARPRRRRLCSASACPSGKRAPPTRPFLRRRPPAGPAVLRSALQDPQRSPPRAAARPFPELSPKYGPQPRTCSPPQECTCPRFPPSKNRSPSATPSTTPKCPRPFCLLEEANRRPACQAHPDRRAAPRSRVPSRRRRSSAKATPSCSSCACPSCSSTATTLLRTAWITTSWPCTSTAWCGATTWAGCCSEPRPYSRTTCRARSGTRRKGTRPAPIPPRPPPCVRPPRPARTGPPTARWRPPGRRRRARRTTSPTPFRRPPPRCAIPPPSEPRSGWFLDLWRFLIPILIRLLKSFTLGRILGSIVSLPCLSESTTILKCK